MKQIFILVFSTIVFHSSGQYQIDLLPRSSPAKSISQVIGYTQIKIDYSSPKVHNRDIWGELVPYGQVWRAGANEATTIEFNEDVLVDGRKLPKGKYSFFIEPNSKRTWTCIFNHVTDQWGAFDYKKGNDALRLPVKTKMVDFSEQLIYGIESKDYDHGCITMHWENLAIEIPIQTAYVSHLITAVDKKSRELEAPLDWIVLLQGAEFLLEQDTLLKQARNWINQSEKLSHGVYDWKAQYYPKSFILSHLYWVKARLELESANPCHAITYLQKLREEPNSFYSVPSMKLDIDSLLDQAENLCKR